MYRYVLKEYRRTICSYGFCFYCQSETDNVNIEHIIPLSNGGTSDLSNLTGACSKCNSMKGVFSIDQFLKRVEHKRDKVFDNFLSYSGRYRRYRSRNLNHSELKWLYDRMIISRKQHNYYTRIINSIINKKYIING